MRRPINGRTNVENHLCTLGCFAWNIVQCCQYWSLCSLWRFMASTALYEFAPASLFIDVILLTTPKTNLSILELQAIMLNGPLFYLCCVLGCQHHLRLTTKTYLHIWRLELLLFEVLAPIQTCILKIINIQRWHKKRKLFYNSINLDVKKEINFIYSNS